MSFQAQQHKKGTANSFSGYKSLGKVRLMYLEAKLH